MSVRADSSQHDDLTTLRWYALIIVVALVVLVSRLFYLQIVTGTRHRLASLDNIIQTVTSPAPRGDIYDRAGVALAKNKNIFTLLYLPPQDMNDYFLTASELSLLSSLTREQMERLKVLNPKGFTAFRGAIAKALDPLGNLEDARYSNMLDQPAMQAPGLQSTLTGNAAWAGALSLRQLDWLRQVRRNPAEMLPGIIEFVRLHRKDPFLQRKAGTALTDIANLARFLGVPYEELMQRLKQESRRSYGYQPLPVYDELTRTQVVYLAEHAPEFEGLMIEQYSFTREYPLGPQATHLVGYTGAMSDKDADLFQGLGYGPQDLVGKEGVERSFESMVHGVPGWRDIEVDRNRIYRKMVRQVKPTKGMDLYLTVDAKVQAKAQQVLGGQPGAIIVSCLKPGHEGEIIALASSPSYDPSRFKDASYFNGLLTSNSRPLLNRTYRNAYPPGSTFKIVTATAALQTGKYTPGSSFYCPGYLELGKGKGKRKFNCHTRSGHGGVTLLQAIAVSCDVAFYTIGLHLDDPPTTLKRFAENFGFGSPVGLELPNEVSGIVPDAEYKKRHFIAMGYGPELWYSGDTANYSIGQGLLTTTPLQVLWSAQLVALEGRWHPPRLLYAKTLDGRVSPVPPPEASRRPLDLKALKQVAEGLRLAVTAGTCRKLNLGGMHVCAKTGTAESGVRGQTDHAWVTGYYPMENPKYAFVVFAEHGGGSGEAAVPKARALLEFMRSYDPVKDKPKPKPKR